MGLIALVAEGLAVLMSFRRLWHDGARRKPPGERRRRTTSATSRALDSRTISGRRSRQRLRRKGCSPALGYGLPCSRRPAAPASGSRSAGPGRKNLTDTRLDTVGARSVSPDTCHVPSKTKLDATSSRFASLIRTTASSKSRRSGLAQPGLQLAHHIRPHPDQSDRTWRSPIHHGQLVSGNYFSTLGIHPALGRGFLPEEDASLGATPVAVISFGLWRRMFDGDPGVTSRSLRLNGRNYMIVGVAPSGFQGINSIYAADVWVPMAMYQQIYPTPAWVNQRRALIFSVAAGSKPGVGMSQAQAGLERLGAGVGAAVSRRQPRPPDQADPHRRSRRHH